MPSTLAPDRLMLAVVAVPRGSAFQPLWLRDTLSEGFRRLVTLPPHLVGYRQRYNGSGQLLAPFLGAMPDNHPSDLSGRTAESKTTIALPRQRDRHMARFRHVLSLFEDSATRSMFVQGLFSVKNECGLPHSLVIFEYASHIQ